MGYMKMTAQGIGQGMDCCDGGIGERLPSQHGSQKHRLPRVEVRTICADLPNVGRQQEQRLFCQHVRVGVFLRL